MQYFHQEGEGGVRRVRPMLDPPLLASGYMYQERPPSPYFFSIQVGLDIFVRFNRDVEPMWACNLDEYYTDFKSRVQNVNIKRRRNLFANNTWDGNLMLFYN